MHTRTLMPRGKVSKFMRTTDPKELIRWPVHTLQTVTPKTAKTIVTPVDPWGRARFSARDWARCLSPQSTWLEIGRTVLFARAHRPHQQRAGEKQIPRICLFKVTRTAASNPILLICAHPQIPSFGNATESKNFTKTITAHVPSAIEGFLVTACALPSVYRWTAPGLRQCCLSHVRGTSAER